MKSQYSLLVHSMTSFKDTNYINSKISTTQHSPISLNIVIASTYKVLRHVGKKSRSPGRLMCKHDVFVELDMDV